MPCWAFLADSTDTDENDPISDRGWNELFSSPSVCNFSNHWRQVLGVARIDQIHFKAAVFQNLVQWNPIHSSRLHGYRLYSTTLQPVGETMQFRRRTLKPAYWFWISVRPHRDVM